MDLMSRIDKYSEVSGDEFTAKMKAFIVMVGVDFEQVKKYLSLFPSCRIGCIYIQKVDDKLMDIHIKKKIKIHKVKLSKAPIKNGCFRL